MAELSRREVLKVGARLAALMGLSAALAPQVAQGVEALTSGDVPVLWLQAQSCTGCSITTLNSMQPDPVRLLVQLISMRFHSNLSASSGLVAMDVIDKTTDAGGFYLVVEGSVPVGMPMACMVGEEPLATRIAKAASKAKAIIALGTCATFGGIPAAEHNPTGAVSLPTFLRSQKIATPVISIPGCPPHPDWLIGSLVHVLKFGIPPLDSLGRPKAFFNRIVHDQCPRFADYEREKFAKTFSEDGCLFQLGCLGPNTRADCTLRQWNSGVNSCIKSGAPCIGCASPEFAAKASFPFYPREALAQAARRKEVSKI